MELWICAEQTGEHTFAFSETREWVLPVFETSHGDDQQLEAVRGSTPFATLMQLMETSDGPLTEEDLYKLKSAMIATPEFLKMTTNDELCSLFDHAAAGPARWRDLVEWMVPMGALHAQPKHCRWRAAPAFVAPQDSHHFCNELTVHSAAKVDETEIVRLILEMGQYGDTDTVMYHTRESLAHIAVKSGHRELFGC